MGIFGGGKKKERRKRLVPVEMRRRVYLPPSSRRPGFRISSREYRIFKRSENRKLSWYEKLVSLASRIISVKADPRMRDDISKAISFSGLRATPDGVMSLFVLTVIGFVVMGGVFALNSIIGSLAAGKPVSMLSVGIGLAIAASGFMVGYYLLKYPINLVKAMRIRASSQVVLAILYMVISMRVSPNLERALEFASYNISGELAWDMRRLLWDIEMRKYYSTSEALSDYIEKWKPENEEFSEALRLIRDSQNHPPERARKVLDQALDVILDGTKTRMKHYAQELKMPVMIIHMMGVVLPILGTIIAPLAAVFMSDIVGPVHFIIGYNVLLPITILWFIQNTLSRRPMTFSQIDISSIPNLPRKGAFRKGGIDIPVLPLAILVLVAVTAVPLWFFSDNYMLLTTGTNEYGTHGTFELVMSMLIVFGIAISISVYAVLSNMQRYYIQRRVQKTESQFEIAMFHLGNRIAGGTPTELAVEKCIDDMKDLEIAGLFRRTLRNMRNLGMTFEDALFNKKWGALLFYPSRLIRNIMLAVTDTARTGITYAAESMLRIARYLKNIRETQEYIRDILSDTVSSMKFQAYFLTPIITGLIVSMSTIIVLVLEKLGEYLDGIDMGSAMGITDFSSAFNMKVNTSPEIFQLIVGIYLIEVVIILGIFLTKISEGENKISQWYTVGKMLAIAVVIYFIVAFISGEMFSGLVKEAISNIMA